MSNLLGALFGEPGSIYPIPYGYNHIHYQRELELIAQQARQQAQYLPCIHPDCPICAENNKRQQEGIEALKQQERIKKENYKKRCEKFMKEWRKRGKE